MDLLRATKQNKIFSELEIQWQGQIAKYEENFAEFSSALREQAQNIINSNDSEYNIYVLNKSGSYDAFLTTCLTHQKGLPGKTFRVIEVVVSPYHDYADDSVDSVASLASSVIRNVLELAFQEEVKADNIKIHMGRLSGNFNLAFMAHFMQEGGELFAETHGAWITLKKES